MTEYRIIYNALGPGSWRSWEDTLHHLHTKTQQPFARGWRVEQHYPGGLIMQYDASKARGAYRF